MDIVRSSNETDPSGRAIFEVTRYVIGLFIYPVVCVVGVLMNCICFVVFRHRRMKSTPVNTLLCGLVVSDNLKLFNDFLYFIAVYAIAANQIAGERVMAKLYPFSHYFNNLTACSTAWFTLVIAVERFLQARNSPWSRRFCSAENNFRVVIGIFGVALLLNIPAYFRYEMVPSNNTQTGETEYVITLTPFGRNEAVTMVYAWTMNGLRSLLPLPLLFYLNGYIICSVRRTNPLRTERQQEASERLTTMLAAVVGLFLLTYTPDAVLTTAFKRGYIEENFHIRTVREVTDLLMTVNSSINFPIYMSLSAAFRQICADVLCPLPQTVGDSDIVTANHLDGNHQNHDHPENHAESQRLNESQV